jgi:cysteine desulfurase
MSTPRVYLDHAATTPLSDAARAKMRHLLDFLAGNPSSPHLEGRAAKDALEAARSQAADALGCRPRELVFTSGATEAAQIALYGAAIARRAVSPRIVVSAVEHPAVLEAAEALGQSGFDLVVVSVDERGVVSEDRFVAACEDGAALAALMLANHETGALQPVAPVARRLAERSIPLLCDAALAPGRLPCAPAALGAPLVVYSAHKVGGPVGAGALYVRRGTTLAPWLRGGIQEERLRPGTENVAACGAFALALHDACRATAARAARYAALVETFLDALAALGDWQVVGPRTQRVPGLVTIELPGVEGEAAMINMDLEGFAVSTGSTCALGSSDPSPGLLAMGLSRSRAASTLRISVGEGVADEAMQRAASSLQHIVSRLRALAR